MYLHIGNGKSIRKSRVIGIFDLDTSTVTPVGKKFLSAMERSGRAEYADDDLPRSFVLSDGDGECKVSLSRLSSAALKARALGEKEEIQ